MVFELFQAAAVTFIVTRSGIFAWLRRGPAAWRGFITCPLCVGFWVGAALSALRLWLSKPWILQEFGTIRASYPVLGDAALDVVGQGALVGVVALLLACAVDWMDATERAAKKGTGG